MIKYHKFTFELLDVDNHWLAFPVFGPVLTSENFFAEDYHDVAIHLSPDKAYQIGMDQSTSNSGIFIKDFENTEAYMIEVRGEKNQDTSDYTYNLEMMLHELFQNCNVTHIIYERPINTANFRSARALFQLEGMIRTLSKRYKEFRTAKLDCIENSSWRAVVIDKSLDSTVYSRKDLSMMSVINMWPWTGDYGGSLKSDQDIFEAIGVMMGWFYCSFDYMGRPYVRGDRTKRRVGVLILPGVSAQGVYNELKTQGVKCRFAVENPRYSIYQNLCSMVEPYDTLCVEFNNSYSMLCLCVESNIKWENFEVMTAVISDASCVDTKLKEIAGGSFQFVI